MTYCLNNCAQRIVSILMSQLKYILVFFIYNLVMPTHVSRSVDDPSQRVGDCYIRVYWRYYTL